MLHERSMVKLVCKNGHGSDHPLGRVLRLNDAWCPKCGADMPYTPAAPADPTETKEDGPLRSVAG